MNPNPFTTVPARVQLISSSPKAFLILDKLSSILHQGQLAFQTASAPFASEPLAILTATAPVRRPAARVSNLNPFASRPARVQLASSSRSCPARGSFSWWSGFNNLLN
ncbi:hypothetical protein F2Q69_00031749 [Brassica cretica]|uniref:Uncharacterized protein n=1 Tax=Brassica cretica TaxID=69181 RepID=A0A8S9RUL1_BRACR|nr:hypothetical protein F2Q69_00031749 [Brassica cretica]